VVCCPGSIPCSLSIHSSCMCMCVWVCACVEQEHRKQRNNHTRAYDRVEQVRETNIALPSVSMHFRDLLQNLRIRSQRIIPIRLSPDPPWHIIHPTCDLRFDRQERGRTSALMYPSICRACALSGLPRGSCWRVSCSWFGWCASVPTIRSPYRHNSFNKRVKIAVFWDVETQFAPHRRHITSPPYCYVRFEFFTAVTMKNAVIWDVNAAWLL
jgi:hypothetical protein